MAVVGQQYCSCHVRHKDGSSMKVLKNLVLSEQPEDFRPRHEIELQKLYIAVCYVANYNKV